MWKRDKKDFAREMGKLKRLKDQLAFMEQDYLIEYQVRGKGGQGRRAATATQAGEHRRPDSGAIRRVADSSPIQEKPPSPHPLKFHPQKPLL